MASHALSILTGYDMIQRPAIPLITRFWTTGLLTCKKSISTWSTIQLFCAGCNIDIKFGADWAADLSNVKHNKRIKVRKVLGVAALDMMTSLSNDFYYNFANDVIH